MNSQVFAYENGLLQGKNPSSFFGFNSDELVKVTDNDLDSGVRFGSAPYYLVYNLENPTDLSHVFIKSSDYFVLYFYDPSGRQIGDYVRVRSTIGQKFNLNILNVKSIKVHPNSYGYTLFELDVYPQADTISPSEVSDLVATEIGSDYFSISWNNPEDNDFIGNEIYINNVLKATLDKTQTSYTFSDLSPNTSYTVKVISFDNSNNYSNAVTITIKTLVPSPKEVRDLKADTKYDRIKLSWIRPEDEFFSHVNIYRKVVEDESFFDQLFGSSSVSAATTSDGYTPMFETNGTYWTDLTVDPDTTYSYKVTSENIEGKESEGVTIEATTPPEPLPTMNGVSTRQDENGDYVVTWTSPTTGKVKVLIDGNEYATIDAATQKIIIPKEDMKLNFFGGYDARLVPISEKGTEGKSVQVPVVGETKVNPPFSFEEFMQTVISLLAWAAPFILLSFVLIFWRPIVEFIKKTLANAKGGRVKQ